MGSGDEFHTRTSPYPLDLLISFLTLVLAPRLHSLIITVILQAFLSFSAFPQGIAAKFERIGPYGGDVRSLLINFHKPLTAYLGTSDGQIYKSTDGGASWTLLLPGIGRRQFALDTLVQHPAEPNHLYAGGWELQSNGGGLFESRDAGLTWRAVALPQASPAVRDLAIGRSNPSRMIVGTLNGVFVTQDGGTTWKPAGVTSPGFRNVESVAINPRNPNVLLVGTWHLAYRSLDFGQTWVRVSRGMYHDSDVFSVTFDPRRPGIVYAGACSGIYRSSNLADDWTRIRVFPERFTVRTRTVLVDPADSSRVFAGTTEGVFLTGDAGQTWKRITSRFFTVNAIQVDPQNPRRILIGTDDYGILRSEDGGETWLESSSGFVHRQISRVIAETQGRFYAGVLSDGRNGGFYLFDNYQNRWQQVTAELVTRVPEVQAFLPLPDQRGRLAGTVRGIYWQQSPASPWIKLEGETGSLSINDLILERENTWIFAATSSGIYRARPAELEFRNPTEPRFAPKVSSIAVSRSAPDLLYAAGNLGVIRSLDRGVTWEILPAGLPSRGPVECVAVSPSDKERLFAGTPAGLYESRNGGVSWTKPGDGRLTVDVSSVIFLDASGQRIMAADNTFGGVFLSNDSGRSWEKIEAPGFRSPVRTISQDPASPSIVYLGTNSDGVYRLRLPDPSP